MTTGGILATMLVVNIALLYDKLKPKLWEARLLVIALTIWILSSLLPFHLTGFIPFAWFDDTDLLGVLTFSCVYLSVRYFRSIFEGFSLIAGLYTLAVLITCLFQFAGYEQIVWRHGLQFTYSDYHRPHGISMTPLQAGLVALIGWGIGASLAMNQNRLLKWVGLGLTTLSAIVIYLTFSRSAWLGLITSSLLWAYLSFRRKELKVLPTLFMTAVVWVILSVLLPSGWSRVGYAIKGDPSTQARLTFWSQALSDLIRHPFGVGTISEQIRSSTTHGAEAINTQVSSLYLNIGLKYGLLALGILIILLGMLAIRSLKELKHSPASFKSALGVCAIATMICVTFFDPLYDIFATLLLWGFWGATSATVGNG